jgi:hypothetical protein
MTQLEKENRSGPTGVRLCCAAARAGDPVQIIEGERVVSAACAGTRIRFCTSRFGLTLLRIDAHTRRIQLR